MHIILLEISCHGSHTILIHINTYLRRLFIKSGCFHVFIHINTFHFANLYYPMQNHPAFKHLKVTTFTVLTKVIQSL